MIVMRHQIYFSDETSQELRNYVKAKYGEHRALSLVVQQAVDEFLKSEKDKGAWIEEQKKIK